MLPTFEVVGEAAVINRTYRRGRNIGVGDVVAYDIPVEKKDTGMKRVIGMPGDYVLINSPESGSSEMIQVRRAKILQPPLLYFLFSGSLSPF